MQIKWKTLLILNTLPFVGISYQANAALLTINAEVNWTDRNGNVHDARNVRTEFWDDGGILPDNLLDTQQTNNSGNASTVVNNDDRELTFLDPFIRVFPRSTAAFVSPNGTLGNTYQIETATTDNVPGPVHNISVTAGNVDNIGRSFSVHQAIQFHHDYATTKLGAVTPAGGVAVTFPATATNANISSMNVSQGNWADWDVIQHEYGHVLAFNNNLMGDSVGLAHFFGVDNINERGNEIGSRLAWQEGIATKVYQHKMPEI